MDGRGPTQVRAGDDPGGAAAGDDHAAGADDGRARPQPRVGRERVWSTLIMLQALWHLARDGWCLNKVRDVENGLRALLREAGLKLGTPARKEFAARVRELVGADPVLSA